MKWQILALLTLGLQANAGTLYSDLGTGGSVYDNTSPVVFKGSGSGGSSITQARPFTVSGIGDFLLTEIDLGIVYNTGVHTFTAGIWTDFSNHPGAMLASWNMSISEPVGSCCLLASQTGITGLTLAGGTTYFMVVGPQSLTDNSDNFWESNTVGATGAQLGSLDGGSTWINDSTGTLPAFAVQGDAVTTTPEPNSLVLLGTGLVAACAALRHKRCSAGHP